MGTPPSFPSGDWFLASCLLPCNAKSFQKPSSYKGKNLLLEEHILTCKRSFSLSRGAKMNTAELLTLGVYVDKPVLPRISCTVFIGYKTGFPSLE